MSNTGAKKTQGRKIIGTAAAVDLDALIADRALDPKPIRLFGVEYRVRRDFTPNEATQWLQHMRATTPVTVDDAEVEGEVAALQMLLGVPIADAVQINDRLKDIPREHTQIIAHELISLAGLGDLVGLGSGESSAS